MDPHGGKHHPDLLHQWRTLQRQSFKVHVSSVWDFPSLLTREGTCLRRLRCESRTRSVGREEISMKSSLLWCLVLCYTSSTCYLVRDMQCQQRTNTPHSGAGIQTAVHNTFRVFTRLIFLRSTPEPQTTEQSYWLER